MKTFNEKNVTEDELWAYYMKEYESALGFFYYAHVVADTRGFDPQIPTENKVYLRRIIINTIISFLRFYHYIPRPAMKTIWEWAGKPLALTIHRIKQRLPG